MLNSNATTIGFLVAAKWSNLSGHITSENNLGVGYCIGYSDVLIRTKYCWKKNEVDTFFWLKFNVWQGITFSYLINLSGYMFINTKVRDSPKGKVSSTKFTRISSNGTHSIVLCEPVTGRTHQVRRLLPDFVWLFSSYPNLNCLFEYVFCFSFLFYPFFLFRSL